jgi:dihydroflavonol-4-reductase
VGYPDGLADETMPYNGNTIRFAYMHSKYAAEAVANQYSARGLAIVTVCPAAVIAPYCDRAHGWGRVFLDVLNGALHFVPCGGIAIVSRADLVQGLQAAMAVGRPGERYILASANVSYQTLMETISRTLGVAAPRLKVSRWLLRIGARLLASLAPVIESLVARPRISAGILDLMWRRKYYAVGKAERELGFSSTQTLEEAVHETWDWLRANPRAARHTDGD